MELFKNKYVLILLRVIVGGVFIYASIDKLFHAAEFAKAIYNYRMPFQSLVNILAIVLPYIEFFTGAFLILGIFKRGAAVLIMVMLGVFLIALVQAYARGLDINCGCFSLGTSSPKSDILMRIVEDILLFFGAYIIYKFTGVPKREDNTESINTENQTPHIIAEGEKNNV